MDKRGYIAFVWDDGFLTDKTIAMQMQLDRGLNPKGTSYIIGQAVLGTSANRLHVDDCLEMLDNGWDLQDHTFTHPTTTHQFVDFTGTEMREELQKSNDFFVNTLHTAIPQHWSIPGGTLTKKVLDVVGRERKTIMVGGSRFITPYTNALTFPSFDISPTYEYIASRDASTTDRKLTIRKVIDDVVKYGYGAVLYCHEMVDQSEIDAYEDALDYALQSGSQLVTVSEMYDIFKPRGYNNPIK